MIIMNDALPLFGKSRLGGECDLCCFFYGYSQPCCSLLEASSINKLVHSLAGAFLSVQPDQMNNSEHSCTFSPVWMITDQLAPQLSWLTKWLTTFWTIVVLHSTMGEHLLFQRARHTKWLLHSTHLYGWTEYLSSMPVPEDANIVCDICACRGKGGAFFIIWTWVEVWCNK